MNDDHIPVPAEHAPRKRMDRSDDRIAISEEKNPAAWVSCLKADTVSVKR